MDDSIKPCSEIGDDDCPTPWDYCCGVGKEDLAKATALIKLVGDEDKPAATMRDDARTDRVANCRRARQSEAR